MAHLASQKKIDQRLCIQFCQKVGETCKDIFEKLQKVCEEDCMNCMSLLNIQVYEWFKCFKDGCKSIEHSLEWWTFRKTFNQQEWPQRWISCARKPQKHHSRANRWFKY